MLNLEDLEKRLDEALEKETTESLTRWLMSKRFKNHIADNGEGEFDVLIRKNSEFIHKCKPNILEPETNKTLAGEYNYATAA
jgi:hypothetical protein